MDETTGGGTVLLIDGLRARDSTSLLTFIDAMTFEACSCEPNHVLVQGLSLSQIYYCCCLIARCTGSDEGLQGQAVGSEVLRPRDSNPSSFARTSCGKREKLQPRL